MLNSIRNGLKSLLSDVTGNFSSRLCAGWLLLINFIVQSWFVFDSTLLEIELYTAAAMLGLSVVDNFTFRNKYLKGKENEDKASFGSGDNGSTQLDLFDHKG